MLWYDESAPFSLAPFGERSLSVCCEAVAPSLLALLTDKSTENELREEVSEKPAPDEPLWEGVSVLSASAERLRDPRVAVVAVVVVVAVAVVPVCCFLIPFWQDMEQKSLDLP